MKKVSLLVGTVLFAGITAFGQNQIGSGANNIEEEYVLEEAAAGTAVMTNRKAKVSKSGSLAAPGQVFVSENFSSGKIPSNWTVKTNSSQAGGWVWTDKGSQGQYSGKASARNWTILSTTASNGFMILDGDNMNPGASTSFSTVDAYVEIPLPSLASVKAISMEFQHFWRPFSNVEMYVLTTKNGTTWDTVKVDHSVPVNGLSSTHFGYANGGAYLEKISLSKALAGGTSPKVRIHWGGSSHYYWQIDDIKIVEGEYNDIDMAQGWARPLSDTTRLNYGDYYSQIPLKQASKTEMGFSATYVNSGSAVQPNARVNLKISGPSGYTDSGVSSPRTLSYLATDSNSIPRTDYKLNAGLGMYNADLYPTSDCTLTNNDLDTIGYDIEVTDSVFARYTSNPANSGAVYYNPANVSQYEAATYFELVEMDTISSVSFWMPSANVRRPNKPGLLQVHVYRTIGLGASGVQQIQTAPLFSSAKVKISDIKIPTTGGWVTMAVKRNTAGVADTVNPGGLIASFIADQFFGTDTIMLSFDGRDGWQSHNFLRQEQAGTWGNWGYTSNKNFIRLNSKPNFCPTLDGSVAATATTACGNTDGSASVTDPTKGKSPYRYAWNTPGNPSNKTITNLPSGIYQVTITDANGCAQVENVNVSDAGAPIITDKSNTPTTCAGKGQGGIEFTLTPGSSGPGYTFVWLDNKGDTVKIGGNVTSINEKLAGVEAGTYTVQVLDKGTPPCLQTKKYTIAGPTGVLTVTTSSVIDATCNGDKDGSVTISPAGGTGTVTISWPSGGSAATESGLAAGAVIVTLTDANSCKYNETYTVAEPPAVVINTGSVIENNGSGNVTIIPGTIGGNPGYSHIWTNSAGVTCDASSGTGQITIGAGQAAKQQSKGTYTVNVQDVNGCKGNRDYILNQTVLGLGSFGTNYELKIFPNPNNGSFKVSMSNVEEGNYSLEVKNMLGQVVYSESFDVSGNYNNTIELAVTGVYFLNISNGVDTESYKVVVE